MGLPYTSPIMRQSTRNDVINSAEYALHTDSPSLNRVGGPVLYLMCFTILGFVSFPIPLHSVSSRTVLQTGRPVGAHLPDLPIPRIANC